MGILTKFVNLVPRRLSPMATSRIANLLLAIFILILLIDDSISGKDKCKGKKHKKKCHSTGKSDETTVHPDVDCYNSGKAEGNAPCNENADCCFDSCVDLEGSGKKVCVECIDNSGCLAVYPEGGSDCNFATNLCSKPS